MERQTLELEIEYTWWMWRGCLQDYYGDHYPVWPYPVHQGEDGTDRQDYMEASAFPMQKPNFDVFGIPGRTRKQRGWYHVQRHPKSRPKQHIIFPASEYSPGASATGADLPIELVRLVGEMMSERHRWGDCEDKRTMITCALVCRHWASQFLPKIFDIVSIHSRRRAFGLWEFDRSPARCFHRVCNSKVIVQMRSLSELSFIHLLAQIRCPVEGVFLQGPLPRGWKTLRSVHQALPRSLPRSFSSGITSLSLTDIHFQRFSDLTHLVCELPDLTHFQCDKVTSGPVPDTIATFPRLRRTSTLYANMDSDVGMPAAVHLLAHRLTDKESPFLPRANAVLALASLVDGIFSVLEADSNKYLRTVQAYSVIDVVSLVWYYQNWGRVARISARISRIGHHGEIVDLNVTAVIVDLSISSNDQHSRWNTFNWRELDEQVSVLGAQLVFGCNSRDQLLAFADRVVDALMPRLSARDSIRYAVGDEDKWYKASRDSDVLQGPPDLLESLYL